MFDALRPQNPAKTDNTETNVYVRVPFKNFGSTS